MIALSVLEEQPAVSLSPRINDRVFGFDDLGNACPWRAGTIRTVLPAEWHDFVTTAGCLVSWDDGETSVVAADRLVPAMSSAGPPSLATDHSTR